MSDIKKFLIVRVKKYKSNSAIAGEIKHNNRESVADNDDIDISKSRLNVRTGFTNREEVFDKLKERISTTTRKARPDANKILEYIYSASPEWQDLQTPETLDAFYEKGLEYLKKKHGAENVIGSWIHKDESSFHMHVFVCPIVKTMKLDKKNNTEVEDIRLNAKHFLDGKIGCSILQTDFYNACGVPFGLERGIEKSGVKHVEQRQWKKEQLDKALEAAEKLKLINESINTNLKFDKANFDMKSKALNYQEKLFKEKLEKFNKDLKGFTELKTLASKPELAGMILFLDKNKTALDMLNVMKTNESLVSYFADSMNSWDSLGIIPAANSVNWSNDNAADDYLKSLDNDTQNQGIDINNDFTID